MCRWKLCCHLIAMMMAAAPAFGADEPAPPAGSETAAEEKPAREERAQESRRLLEEVLMARLTRELALDEEQTVLVVRHLAEFRDKMAALRRERFTLARALRQAVRESKDEEAIARMLGELVAHDDKTAEAREEILDIEGLELTTWQQAKLFLFMHDFETDMRRLLKQAQERRLANMRRQERTGEAAGGPHETPEAAEAPAGDGAAPEPTTEE